MRYIEMALPLDISNSELLVAAPTLPAKETPVDYFVEAWDPHFFGMEIRRGVLILRNKAQLRNATNRGTSVIKILCARPFRPQNNILHMLMSRLFE